MLFFKAEWDVLNPVRKLVMNIYAPDPIEIKRVSIKRFNMSVFIMMDEWLNRRLELGSSYETPVMSSVDEYHEEQSQRISALCVKLCTAQQTEKVFYNYLTVDDGQECAEIEEQVQELMQKSTSIRRHTLTKRFARLYVDIIRQPRSNMFKQQKTITH